MRQSPLSAIERAEAGRALAKLGDPRAAVLDPLQIEWIEIPAGPFIMGSDEVDREKPQHIYEIPAAYRIARYPITNAQFQHFVDEGGYTQAAYWAEATQHGYWTPEGIKGWRDQTPRTKPMAYGEPFHLPNHPAVGVTWYESLAFTRWLTEKLQKANQLPTGWSVRLPTEAEWEKAARGEDGQPYPWPGDQPDPNRANYSDTGINSTNAVGAFPSGVSPYGVEEMAGNVWEWCSTLWGAGVSKPDFDYPYVLTDGRENLAADNRTRRVLRGGTFLYEVNLVRCADRGRSDPNYESGRFGFRVVVSPFTPGL
jgi:formylglycine-generating enzyme required for sulfatase activity